MKLAMEELQCNSEMDQFISYTNQSTDTVNINEMHRLAKAGQGLNSYIGKVVKKGYARKFR
jgi:hypothetical protein